MNAVLFDLEGTLVDCFASYRKFISDSREKLIDLGVPTKELGDLSKSSLMINNGLDYVERKFSEKKVKEFHFELNQFLKKYEMLWAEQSSNFPDTVSTLNKLKSLNCQMGLVTNTSRTAMNRIIEKNEIGKFFEVIVSRSDVKRLKPDPEGILLALNKLKVNDFFFVGDLIYDLKATETVGGVSIIVDRDSSKLHFDANYIITSLDEIPEIVVNHQILTDP